MTHCEWFNCTRALKKQIPHNVPFALFCGGFNWNESAVCLLESVQKDFVFTFIYYVFVRFIAVVFNFG